MKQYIIKILNLLLIVTGTLSCSEDFMDHNIVDDKVYLQQSGFSETAIFNWGTYSYNLAVIKSGKGMQGAQLKLAIEDSILVNYNEANNTSYKMLPENCYSIKTSEISFSDKDYRKSFVVDFIPEEITKLQNNSEDTYVLPCQMLILNNSIGAADEEKMSTILSPVIKQPYLKLVNTGLFLPGLSLSPSSDEMQLIYNKIETNYPNQWNLTYTLEIDPTILTNYNEANETSYKLLPEEAYELNTSDWKLRPNETEQYFTIKVKTAGLVSNDGKYMFGEYVLPIRLATVSIHGINPEANTLLYPVIFQEEEIEVDNE